MPLDRSPFLLHGSGMRMMSSDLLPAAVAEAVRRIVAVADPDRIVLFGSLARGEATAASDMDLLVVKNVADRRGLAQRIYRSLIGVGRPVDVVVVTADDVQRFGQSPATVIAPALREGVLLYERRTIAA